MNRSLLVGCLGLLVVASAGVGSAQAQSCLGDCDSDNNVEINELILGVNISLGLQPISVCPQFGAPPVSISDLVRAVLNSLEGCPPLPTPTITLTPEATATEVATATPEVATATPVATDTAAPTDTPDVGDTPTATAVATETGEPGTPTATADATATAEATATGEPGTPTETPEATETQEATETPEATETGEPGTPTETPEATETGEPGTPTETPEATETGEPGTPTATPEATETGEPGTPTATAEATETGEPGTPTATAEATETGEPGTPTATPEATATSEPGTPTATAEATATSEPGTPTATADDTETPALPTATATATETETEVPATATATATPTETSAGAPTATATATATATKDPALVQLEGLLSGVLNDIFPVDPVEVAEAALSGQAAEPCESGGTRTAECQDLAEGSLQDISFDQCATVSDGIETEIDAGLSVVADGTCEDPYLAGETSQASFDGTVTKTVVDTQASFAAAEDLMFTFSVSAANTLTFAVVGTVGASCVDAEATIQTLQPIVLPSGATCPTAGRYVIVIGGELHEISYTGTGGVVIDVNDDGFPDAAYTACDDPLIAQCFE